MSLQDDRKKRVESFPTNVWITSGEDDSITETFDAERRIGAEISWVENAISESDVRYVRADLHEAISALNQSRIAVILRLETRLEVSPDHPYDGIASRDETIKLLTTELAAAKARGAQTAEPTLAFTSAELDLIESEMRANVSNINYDRDNQTLKAQYEAVRVKAKAMIAATGSKV